MALTEEQKLVWLSEDFHRIVIADIVSHDGSILSTEHFSSYPYVMPIDDTTDITDITDANNLLTYPIDFDIIQGWIPTNVNVINVNGWQAPDGTITAEKIVADATFSEHEIHVSPADALLVPIGTHTFSVYVLGSGQDYVKLDMWNAIDGSRSATHFNLITGSVDFGPGTITEVGVGWYLLKVTATNTIPQEFPRIFPTDNTYNTTYTGDGVVGIVLWGGMLVPGINTVGYQTLVGNIVYDDIISNVPNIISRIDQNSTVGAIDLLNTDGEYDYLLNDITIVGHTIRLFIGDTNWPRDNFIPILDGIIAGVNSTAPENIQISLRDRKETLNVALQSDLFTQTMLTSEWDLLSPTAQDATNENWHKLMDQVTFTGTVIGSDGIGSINARAYSRALAVLPDDIKNTHVPICLGKCFNIEPVLIDSWNHIYMIHTSGDALIDSLVSVDEVRSNGVPLDSFDTSLKRTMSLLSYTGLFVVGDIITDATDPLIFGTVYAVEGIIAPHIISYTINDPLHDFNSATGIFTGSISGSQALAVAPIIIFQYEVDLALGLIRLLDNPSGTQITCDVVAQAARSSLAIGWTDDLVAYSAAWIIEWILLEKANVPFDDICQFTFPPGAALGFDNISAMGVYYKDEQTILNIVTSIINSVGGFLRFKDAFCKLQIVKLIDPASVLDADIDLYLTDDDIVENGVSIGSIEEPKRSITLGYRKNWKTQDEGSLASSITDIDSPYYNMEILDSYKNDYTSLYELTGISDAEYPLAEDVDLIETSIYNTVDAQDELDRRIILRTPRRRVIRINSLATSFTYDVGDIVHVTHSRFGLDQGKKTIIVGIEESPTNKRVNLDVWV